MLLQQVVEQIYRLQLIKVMQSDTKVRYWPW